MMDYESEFLYFESNNILRYLNHRGVAVRDRNKFITMFKINPDLFKIVKFDMSLRNEEKLDYIVSNIMRRNVASITGIIGNQGSGKDTLACRIIDEIVSRYDVRVVALLCFAKYPWIDDKDYFYLFRDIPSGTPNRPVILYISELDVVFPARDFNSPQNKMLNNRINLLRQRNIIVIGTCKLAVKVDITYWDCCTHFFYKFVDTHSLEIRERKLLGDDYGFLLPQNRFDKSQVLYRFGDEFLTFNYDMSEWYNDDISSQFAKITDEQKRSYFEYLVSDGGFNEKEARSEIEKFFNKPFLE